MDWMRCLLINFGIVFHSQIFGSLSQLVRDRSVQCNSNDMTVSFEFVQPFLGVIYTNQFYPNKDCKWDGNASRQLKVSIPLNSNPASPPYCGVQLKETTGEFTVTLIISPMRGLLVDGMEGLTVRCLYNIGDVTLTLPAGSNGAGIVISHQTQAGIVTGSGGNPFLQMAIRDGHGINGDVVQSAQVGQRLSLDVVMRDTSRKNVLVFRVIRAIYDFYVHDCYAHDGTNTAEASVSIVDPNGCAVRLSRAVDVPVFTTAPVPNGAKHVYIHMYGFQFTTSQLVYFECQVRPCLQTCNRAQCVTGPQLAVAPSSRSRRASHPLLTKHLDDTVQERYSDNYNLTTVIRIEPQELFAVAPAARDSREIIVNSDHGNDFCVSVGVGVGILSVFVLVSLASFGIAVTLCYRAYREGKETDSQQKQSLSSTLYSSSLSTPYDRHFTLSSRQTPSSLYNLQQH